MRFNQKTVERARKLIEGLQGALDGMATVLSVMHIEEEAEAVGEEEKTIKPSAPFELTTDARGEASVLAPCRGFLRDVQVIPQMRPEESLSLKLILNDRTVSECVSKGSAAQVVIVDQPVDPSDKVCVRVVLITPDGTTRRPAPTSVSLTFEEA